MPSSCSAGERRGGSPGKEPPWSLIHARSARRSVAGGSPQPRSSEPQGKKTPSLAEDGWDRGLSLDKACQIISGEVAEAEARVISFEKELKHQQDAPPALFVTELQAALAAASAQVVLAEARVADLDARRKRTVARPETMSKSSQDLQDAHAQVCALKTRVERLQESVGRLASHSPDAAAGTARAKALPNPPPLSLPSQSAAPADASTSPSGRRNALGGSGPCMPATKVLLWNLHLSQLVGNPLEFLPSKGALSSMGNATLGKLLRRADHLMLRPESSPKLLELLGNKPLTQAGAWEKVAIAKVPPGLQRWLESRQAEWADLWPGLDARTAAELWCRDHTARWHFWQRQTLHQWLCDDCSGCKTNTRLPARRPSISEACPDLSLAAADLACGNPPARCARAKWMRYARKAGATFSGCPTGKPPPRHDLFKLLVWDLVLDSVLARLPDAHLGALFRELRMAHSELRMRRVVACAQTADVAILLGVQDAAQTFSVEGFWVVRPQAVDEENRILILARKDIFREPVLESLPGDGGVPDPHVAACTLVRQDQAGRLNVIGVRTPSKKQEARHLAERLEALLQPNTILGVDFGEDPRAGHPWWDVALSLPKLKGLLEQAHGLPSDRATVNKQRSPFQTQVSKMFEHDFEIRDLLFLGERFHPAFPQGLLEPKRRLPDSEVPSDHAPLMVQVRHRGQLYWEEDASAAPVGSAAVDVPPQHPNATPEGEGSRVPADIQAAMVDSEEEATSCGSQRPAPAWESPSAGERETGTEEEAEEELDTTEVSGSVGSTMDEPPAPHAVPMGKLVPFMRRTAKGNSGKDTVTESADRHEVSSAAPAELRPAPGAEVRGGPTGPTGPTGARPQEAGDGGLGLVAHTKPETLDAVLAALGSSALGSACTFCSSLENYILQGGDIPSSSSSTGMQRRAEKAAEGRQAAEGREARSVNLERRVDLLDGMFRTREAQLMEEQVTTAKLRSELDHVQGELRRRREEEDRLREQVQNLEGRLSAMHHAVTSSQQARESGEAEVKIENCPAAKSRSSQAQKSGEAEVKIENRPVAKDRSSQAQESGEAEVRKEKFPAAAKGRSSQARESGEAEARTEKCPAAKGRSSQAQGSGQAEVRTEKCPVAKDRSSQAKGTVEEQKALEAVEMDSFRTAADAQSISDTTMSVEVEADPDEQDRAGCDSRAEFQQQEQAELEQAVGEDSHTYAGEEYNEYAAEEHSEYAAEEYTEYAAEEYTGYAAEEYTEYAAEEYTEYAAEEYTEYAEEEYTEYGADHYASGDYSDYVAEEDAQDAGTWNWDERSEWWQDEGEAENWEEAIAWREAEEPEAWSGNTAGVDQAPVEEEDVQPQNLSPRKARAKSISWGDVETEEVFVQAEEDSWGLHWALLSGKGEVQKMPEERTPKANVKETEVYKDLERSLVEHLRPEDREGMLVEEADDGQLEAVVTPPEALLAELLPESEDTFIKSCRGVAEGARLALSNATRLHMASIASQLGTAMDAQRSGHENLRECVKEACCEDIGEAQRLEVVEEVNARTSELKLLAQDLPVHEDLSAGERQEIFSRLETWIRLCENEQRLLRMPTALGELPESFLVLLVEVSTCPEGREPDVCSDPNRSPVHWAAHQCRRDLLEYFCRHETWKSWLATHDEKGRSPLYYLQGPRGLALLAWLRAEGGVTAPMHQASCRPKELSTLNHRMIGLLDQIEACGWRCAKWEGNYTMLHWAAARGDKALCKYCVQLGADLHAQDRLMRTPLDCAHEVGQRQVVETLGEMMRRPASLICLSAFRDTAPETPHKKPSPRRTVETAFNLSELDNEARRSCDASAGSLPERYLRIWEQSEEIGWEKMEWVDGYTLLHWAAKHGLTEICARLLSQRADPGQKDANGKDAFDYAADSNKATLQRLRLGAPSRLPPVIMTPISQEARHSQEVRVTPEFKEMLQKAGVIKEEEKVVKEERREDDSMEGSEEEGDLEDEEEEEEEEEEESYQSSEEIDLGANPDAG